MGVQNFTNNKAANYSINTRMSKREKIYEILNSMPASEAIALIESIGKDFRKSNSVNVNKRAKVRVVIDRERPDLVELKKGHK